jgi:rubrerythrin
MEDITETNAIRRAVEVEEELIAQYRETRGTVRLQNLREFLGRFIKGNEALKNELSRMKDHTTGDLGNPGEELVYLHSSEHLHQEEKVDVSSLRDLLLFISTMERRSMDDLKQLKPQLSDSSTIERFEGIMREKEKMMARADRLYNDLIQGSY